MCNLYNSTPRERINAKFSVQVPDRPYLAYVAPLKPGPFVCAGGRAAVGQWGMIPPDSKSPKPTLNGFPDGKSMSTNNARRERLGTAKTFRGAWQKSQRCLIPADSFIEPYWGTSKHIAWQFARADGEPWALAGLWVRVDRSGQRRAVRVLYPNHAELRHTPGATADAQAGSAPGPRSAGQANAGADRA